jgi:DnaJ like chaperone protein
MSYWGKLLGGVAGFAVGGPFGAVMGAALGHAADNGSLPKLQLSEKLFETFAFAAPPDSPLDSRDQALTLAIVALSAKLAKVDGPVNRAEIDAFKREFDIQPDQLRIVGQVFDYARRSADDYIVHAEKITQHLIHRPSALEKLLASLFAVARADSEINHHELSFLAATARVFGLGGTAWERARDGAKFAATRSQDDPYSLLGLTRQASNDAVRKAWRKLVRDNHPDRLVSRGATPEVMARATARVASINAAWDQIKRERQL